MKLPLPGVAKQPKIRKGQRKPYRKATRQQIEQRIEGVALLGFCGFRKSDIHRIFREWYGVEWRQTDRYMALARARKRTGSNQAVSASTGDAIFDVLR
jgi:hypothetical protein